MRFLLPRRAFAALATLVALTACDNGASRIIAPSPATSTTIAPATVDLGAEIRSMIATGFPTGFSSAINAKWDQVLRAIAKNDRETLLGRSVPVANSRAALTRTVGFIQMKAGSATPPPGETADHFVARLVLYMSLYVYEGPSAQPPPLTPTSDIALTVVQPTVTDTVATPALQAAAIFPAGAVSEPTVVVVTPVATHYPANCSGPLVTHLCQYPLFYTFNVFPDVKLAVPASVQVCHVDAGVNRRPLADHDRFRISHDRPVNPADYTAGSTIVDSVEVLQLTLMNVTNCPGDGGTTYSALPAPTHPLSPLGRLTYLAASVAHRAAFEARRLLTPREALAIDVGGGGFVQSFSTFGVVDPQSIADLSQSTAPGTQFSVGSTSAHPGDLLAIPTWSVANVGSGTSGAFTSSVVLASDSLLTEPISTTNAGGGAALVPGASYAYPAMSLALPPSLAPGTYFVGTAITPAGADSSSDDDRVSVRLTVAPPQFPGSAEWTSAGAGILSTQVSTPFVTLSYNDTPSGYDPQTFTFTSTAVATDSLTFPWTYTGLHSWFEAYASLEAFALDASGHETVVTLVPNTNVSGDFSFSGTATLPLVAGRAWGIRAHGVHYDYSQILQGTITLGTPPVIP